MPQATPISKDPLARIAEQQDWNTPEFEEASQRAIQKLLSPLGEKGRSILHGDWLHEPLHVIMTDVPVGSWTAAVTFDTIAAVSGSSAMDKAADACVLLGLVGAFGAAVTGANDWAEIEDAAPRRIGAMHAWLNIAATGLFVWSMVARRNSRDRGKGRALAGLGFAIVSASAHLGGNLIYEHGIGVETGKPWSKALTASAE